MKRTISVLGSSGSIGRQTLKVASACGYQVAAVTVNRSVEQAEAQARQFKPKLAVAVDEKAAADLRVRLADTGVKVVSGLEGLLGKIPGLVSIRVQTECLASSNADLMLDSVFTDEEALKGYSVHPAHVEVADTKVRPYAQIRLCLDFEQDGKSVS